MLEIIVNCVGVLGFLISLAIIVRDQRASRVRIKIAHENVFSFLSHKIPGSIVMCLSFQLTNMSSRAISISDISLIGENKEQYLAELEPHLVTGYGSVEKGNNAWIVSSDFPINLEGYQQKRLRIIFHLSQQAISAINLDNIYQRLPSRGIDASQCLPESSDISKSWDYVISISTPVRIVVVKGKAAYGNLNEILDTLYNHSKSRLHQVCG